MSAGEEITVSKLDSGTGTLGKAMDVVDAIATAPRPMRFRDLAAHINQPRGTLHRQVSNLIDEGLLEVRPDQTYGLGIRLLRLAAQSWSGSQFRIVADPHLRQLHLQTAETVHLGVLRGTEVIYLDKVESAQAVRMHSQIGNASPCYCTGVGKAAMAVMPKAELDAAISKITFKRFTDHTLTDEQALRATLDTIRSTGIAYDEEEHETGIHCIAAPIYSQNRSLVAGISVTAPVYRVSRDQLDQWGGLVQAAAGAIMDDMAFRMGPKA